VRLPQSTASCRQTLLQPPPRATVIPGARRSRQVLLRSPIGPPLSLAEHSFLGRFAHSLLAAMTASVATPLASYRGILAPPLGQGDKLPPDRLGLQDAHPSKLLITHPNCSTRAPLAVAAVSFCACAPSRVSIAALLPSGAHAYKAGYRAICLPLSLWFRHW
jgi:hypothetical protein